jgi:hypothetical protein
VLFVAKRRGWEAGLRNCARLGPPGSPVGYLLEAQRATSKRELVRTCFYGGCRPLPAAVAVQFWGHHTDLPVANERPVEAELCRKSVWCPQI